MNWEIVLKNIGNLEVRVLEAEVREYWNIDKLVNRRKNEEFSTDI